MLWNYWWNLVCDIRSVCAQTRTFLWMALCLAGMATRKELLGVTSIVRALGLEPACYDRLLDFFHSPALDLRKLTCAWCALVFRAHPGILRVNGRPVLAGDGIKVAKAGRKMPGVKKLHQQSESNTKPEYIFGHSCQTVAVLTQALSSVFALPLACRIHEGTVFSNRDHRTLLDKMILLIDSLRIQEPFYFVADAYYATGNIVRGLLAHGNHLVTQRKKQQRGLLPGNAPTPAPSAAQGQTGKVWQEDQSRSAAEGGGSTPAQPRLWREGCDPEVPGRRFIVASGRYPRPLCRGTPYSARRHPADVYRPHPLATGHHPNLWPAIQIEVSFKQALRVIGAYAYHFWMAAMTPLRRVSGNQHLHRKSADYRNAVRRKIAAYHRHIQLGLIAQGLLQILSAIQPNLVWQSFGSWIRTVRPGLAPSEQVVAIALRHTFPEFLATAAKTVILVKFLRERPDLSRTEASLAA